MLQFLMEEEGILIFLSFFTNLNATQPEHLFFNFIFLARGQGGGRNMAQDYLLYHLIYFHF